MSWFGRRDDDLRNEIQEHIEMETRENIARGMTEEAARRAAERTFGNSGVTRELVREGKPLFWLDTLWQDVRYGVRQLARSPLLTAIILVTLTLGIGLNGATFALLQGSLFRPHVSQGADRYVQLYPETWNTGRRMVEAEKTTYDDYLAYRASLAKLADVAGYAFVTLVPDVDDTPPYAATLASCNFFHVMGVEQPDLPSNYGRLLQEEDCSSAAPVAVMSKELWETRFGSDPKILGKTVHVNKRELTIVGIAPAEFWGGRDNPALFIPYTAQPLLSPENNLRQPTVAWLRMAGRMMPGVTRAEVQAQAAVVAQQQDKLQPPRRTIIVATDGADVSDPTVNPHISFGIYLLLGVPTLILITACANASTLLLSRAVRRRREMAVRFSLGAGRLRLLRMLITEVLLLAAAATGIATLIVFFGPKALMNFMAMRGNFSLRPDWPVILYLGGATLFAGLVAGLAPALEALRVDLATSMKGEDGTLNPHARGKWQARETLIATQVALSLALLTMAGFCWRSYFRIFNDDPGFDTQHLMLSGVGSRGLKYTPQASDAYWKTLLERTNGVPGVDNAASASTLRGGEIESIRLPGQDAEANRPAAVISVSPTYFETIGLQLLRGRSFSPEEARLANPNVVVISARLAQSLWPGQDALGKTLVAAADPKRTLQVVGVAPDTKSGLFFDADYLFYRVRTGGDMSDTLLVHFHSDPDKLAVALRKIIRELEPQVTPAPRTMASLIEFTTDHIWRASRVILMLALLPVIMSVISIYGVASFAAAQRTREIGIRMTLGASRATVVRLLLRSVATPIATGLVAGLTLAIAVSGVVTQALKEAPVRIDAHDPVAYLGAGVLLAFTTLLAVIGPARRAASADPARALRHD